ncbi:hypothetical protein B0O80DRAFT_463003 [Mortierella sp. GBAus27b]|nr:hypothetical protein B0O80DRAFT_463003 [Mortierella sp. GBAus27b]
MHSTRSFRFIGLFCLVLVCLDLMATFNHQSSSALVMGAPSKSSSSSASHQHRTSKKGGAKKRAVARNPFLTNIEFSGQDSNHHDLVQALGVSIKGRKRGLAAASAAAGSASPIAAAAAGSNSRRSKSSHKKRLE